MGPILERLGRPVLLVLSALDWAVEAAEAARARWPDLPIEAAAMLRHCLPAIHRLPDVAACRLLALCNRCLQFGPVYPVADGARVEPMSVAASIISTWSTMPCGQRSASSS